MAETVFDSMTLAELRAWNRRPFLCLRAQFSLAAIRELEKEPGIYEGYGWKIVEVGLTTFAWKGSRIMLGAPRNKVFEQIVKEEVDGG